MKLPICVAIIPARGGSRRLPRKNLRPFCGLPLVEWSILQCCSAQWFGPENTYLSTDDEEIAEIGRAYGANIIRRPFTGSEDKLTANFWIREAYKQIPRFDVAIHALPTSPLRLPDDLDRAYRRYCELKPLYPDCRSITWTTPRRETVIHRYHDDKRYSMWLLNKSWWFGTNGQASDLYEPDEYIRTTAVGPTDKDVDERASWYEPGVEGSVRFFIQGRWFQAFDIDDRESFEFCELLMERYILHGRGVRAYLDYGGKA